MNIKKESQIINNVIYSPGEYYIGFKSKLKNINCNEDGLYRLGENYFIFMKLEEDGIIFIKRDLINIELEDDLENDIYEFLDPIIINLEDDFLKIYSKTKEIFIDRMEW